jgi:hypothetical protein
VLLNFYAKIKMYITCALINAVTCFVRRVVEVSVLALLLCVCVTEFYAKNKDGKMDIIASDIY